VRAELPNIQLPQRRYHTTNDPVMTTELLDYFFNQRTQGFQYLSEREKALLHSIYSLPEYKAVLPPVFVDTDLQSSLRQHQRYVIKCPGTFGADVDGKTTRYDLKLVEFSEYGFLAHSKVPLPTKVWGEVTIQLGNEERSTVRAMAVRGKTDGMHGFYGFRLAETDVSWRKFIGALKSGTTHDDLDHASVFLADE